MTDLTLNQTNETPQINFNTNGKLLIKGISIGIFLAIRL
jgi:hypothetical protein